MKMFLYAYAVTARKGNIDGTFAVGTMAGANIAPNDKRAYEIAIGVAKDKFPGYAGWSKHDAYLCAIPEEYVNQNELDRYGNGK
jgi:hypothetical protein